MTIMDDLDTAPTAPERTDAPASDPPKAEQPSVPEPQNSPPAKPEQPSVPEPQNSSPAKAEQPSVLEPQNSYSRRSLLQDVQEFIAMPDEVVGILVAEVRQAVPETERHMLLVRLINIAHQLR
jgi:hypothetical protein